MIQKAIRKLSLPLFASAGITAAGLILYQRISLHRASRKGDKTPFESYTTPDGVSMAYERFGYGRPVVLLHSLHPGASRREWRPQIEKLAKDFRVYTVDLPGYGQSDKPTKPWTAYQYAKALHSFLSDVIGKPVALAAANGGADIALVLSMLYPEDLEKMVLISPEGIGRGFATSNDTQQLKKLLSPVIGTQAFLDGTSKKAQRLLAEELFYQKERMPVDFVKNLKQNARYGKGAQASYAGYVTRFAAADTKQTFASLSLPFLLIWGERNVRNSAVYLEEAENLQEKGEFMLFEDTAALPHMENSKAFGQILKDFLSEEDLERKAM